jgi:ABC-2 type transport system permease protein
VKNVLTIYRKELKSYFASPIAYAIMALYALIFGFFFYSATRFFVQASFRSQMMGRGFPMNINEMIVRPLLMNVSVIGLFLIPMLAMRLFAEEKRSGTIELLMTSPVRDLEVILGKWLARLRCTRRSWPWRR